MHCPVNSDQIKKQVSQSTCQFQGHPARLLSMSDKIQFAGKFSFDTFSQTGIIPSNILHSNHMWLCVNDCHSTKLSVYTVTHQVRVVEVPFLVDRSSMGAKRVTSSQANLIISAIYFLIHLPQRETAFSVGRSFCGESTRDSSVVRSAML